MDWFTPERRLFIYRFTTSLVTVAVALGLLTEGTADQVVIVTQQFVTAGAALGSLISTLLASKHISKF